MVAANPVNAVDTELDRMDQTERELKADLGELPSEKVAADSGKPTTEKGRFGMMIEPLPSRSIPGVRSIWPGLPRPLIFRSCHRSAQPWGAPGMHLS